MSTLPRAESTPLRPPMRRPRGYGAPLRPATPRHRARSDDGAQSHDLLRLAARWSPALGLLLCIGGVTWGLATGVLGSLESLRTFVDSLGSWGPLVLLLASFAATVFPIVPGGLLVVAAPILFGPVEGTLYSYLAVCAGSMLNFAIGRQVGLGLIERLFPRRAVEKHLAWTRHPRFSRAFALAILLPVAPDDLLCYLAGTTHMRWRTYVAIILLGKPWTLLAYGLGVSALITGFLPW